VGIDFSPASIAHARSEATQAGLDCAYVLEDLLRADFGSGFDAALFLYGELNTFRRQEVEQLLAKARGALRPGGCLVLELHTEEQVRQLGTATPSWHVSDRGLFADEPYLCLVDRLWDSAARVSAERFTVFRSGSNRPDTYVCTTQAYSDSEYDELLESAGFSQIRRRVSPADAEANVGGGLTMMTAVSPAP
jgi:SAM-dependent methyltransferase